MKQSLFMLAFASAICTAAACGGSDEGSAPDVTCPTDATMVPKYATLKTTALAKCTVCHDSAKLGAARIQAPGNVNYDTYAAAKAKAKDAASEVNEGAMPPKGFGTLTDAEKQALYQWALCGTPE